MESGLYGSGGALHDPASSCRVYFIRLIITVASICSSTTTFRRLGGKDLGKRGGSISSTLNTLLNVEAPEPTPESCLTLYGGRTSRAKNSARSVIVRAESRNELRPRQARVQKRTRMPRLSTLRNDANSASGRSARLHAIKQYISPWQPHTMSISKVYIRQLSSSSFLCLVHALSENPVLERY